MSPVWDDVNVRARGLSSHLLPRQRLAELARVPDLAALGAQLRQAGLTTGEKTDSDPSALEAGVRRFAHRHLGVLSRWCGDRRRHLVLIFEDEDRRSLRALVRGAVAGVDSRTRMRGLIPTESLPERILCELSRLQTPAHITAMLRTIGSPYGAPLASVSALTVPNLLALETAINRTYARRAVAGARGGGKLLEWFVEETIDLDNVESALMLASSREDLDPDAVFIGGGRHISPAGFGAAAGSDDPGRAADVLLVAAAGTPLAAVIETALARGGPIEQSLLSVRLGRMLDRARRAPLSPAPLLAFLMRLRAQSIDLQSIIWAVALDVPRSGVLQTLVSEP